MYVTVELASQNSSTALQFRILSHKGFTGDTALAKEEHLYRARSA